VTAEGLFAEVLHLRYVEYFPKYLVPDTLDSIPNHSTCNMERETLLETLISAVRSISQGNIIYSRPEFTPIYQEETAPMDFILRYCICRYHRASISTSSLKTKRCTSRAQYMKVGLYIETHVIDTLIPNPIKPTSSAPQPQHRAPADPSPSANSPSKPPLPPRPSPSSILPLQPHRAH
jgi:hypothetical protein